ncbi:MAG: hypothetical protein JST37_13245 [Bacteroidetes bacterium]|jgi:hypothetical protein|nr:hypothetical protein [Bacteroidota bacterium]MBS1979912.1 hypothetical protein [Bacteroidota bacterium]
MELLETQDPEKKKLIETSARHKQELERELKNVSDRSEKMLKNALIIGGVLAATYLVITQFSGSKKKKKKASKIVQEAPEEIEGADQEEQPSLLAGVGDRLMSMATVFLVDLAKEKLSDYLKEKKSNDNTGVATGRK